MSARLKTFESLRPHMHWEKISLSQFNISVPQLLMNSGAMSSGSWAFPLFKWPTAACISASVNVSVRDLSPVVTLPLSVAISAFTSLPTCLSRFLWRPFSMSLLAMALELTGHGEVFFARPVSRLKICQACLLEWVKSMEAVVDSHRFLRFSSRVLVS